MTIRETLVCDWCGHEEPYDADHEETHAAWELDAEDLCPTCSAVKDSLVEAAITDARRRCAKK